MPEKTEAKEVRALVGYVRYEGEATLTVMNELYKNWKIKVFSGHFASQKPGYPPSQRSCSETR